MVLTSVNEAATNFFRVRPWFYPEAGDKTSIIFAVPHEAGRLYDALRLFAEAQINLTRIASMPLRSDPSNYSFFLDFEGSHRDEKVKAVLAKLESLTMGMKFLGSYPADASCSGGPSSCG